MNYHIRFIEYNNGVREKDGYYWFDVCRPGKIYKTFGGLELQFADSMLYESIYPLVLNETNADIFCERQSRVPTFFLGIPINKVTRVVIKEPTNGSCNPESFYFGGGNECLWFW
jgi:hypothetical protein